MYGNSNYNREIYSKIVQIEPDQPVLASLVEQCLKEVDWGGKQSIHSPLEKFQVFWRIPEHLKVGGGPGGSEGAEKHI